MANNHGGPRTPSNPAPVSAPGALSRRTDGGPSQTTVPMTGMGYGENADYNDIQSSAPLAAAPSVSNTRARKSSPTGQGAAATPLFAPSGFPEEPVTAGAPFGPGPGPTPAPVPSGTTLTATLQKLALSTSDPRIVSLLTVAQRRGW